MKLDALAIGAHPDDIELSVSGTLIKLAELGYRVGVVDMVRGELGSRGTPAIRAREARGRRSAELENPAVPHERRSVTRARIQARGGRDHCQPVDPVGFLQTRR